MECKCFEDIQAVLLNSKIVASDCGQCVISEGMVLDANISEL